MSLTPGRWNGDCSPLHATPEPGQEMGLGGAIMHSSFSWNTIYHALLQSWGNSDPAYLREFEALFAAPVKPGDKLVTEAWSNGDYQAGWEEIRFLTWVEGGKMVLSNGWALMKCSAPKSRLGAEPKNSVKQYREKHMTFHMVASATVSPGSNKQTG